MGLEEEEAAVGGSGQQWLCSSMYTHCTGIRTQAAATPVKGGEVVRGGGEG